MLGCTLCLLTLKNSFSDEWTREYNGFSSKDVFDLTDGSKISHYKNQGTWKDSLGNYGVQKCMGLIEINSQGRIIDWKLFCQGYDQDEQQFTIEYFRNTDMAAGTGTYVYVDGEGFWKNYIGVTCKYAVSYLQDAMFILEKCKK
tara:strand:- start:155 stop:586 length:432 start_codon:yes stop_codon:yes gene_type:complete